MVSNNIPYQTRPNESTTPLGRQVHFHRSPCTAKIEALFLNPFQGVSMKSSRQQSELTIQNAITNSIRANGRAIFEFKISGVDVFDLLKLLESGATASHRDSFLEVRKCVFLAEKIRNQARRQGF
jgi:hypothetical protein